MIRGMFIILLTVWPGIALFSQIVLNEILFDPAGAESTDEFIEILNTHPSDTIDLSGWKVGDESLDRLRDAGQGFLLPPGVFGLIVDPDNLELTSGYREKIPGTAILLTVESKTLGNAGLSNSEPETIRLVNARDSCVASYRYHIGNSPGYSDEKIDPLGTDDPANWGDSRISGGTPGSRNSVSKVRMNLRVTGIRFDPERPMPNQPVWMIALIQNNGIEPAESVVLFNWDSGCDSISTGWIAPEDSSEFRVLWISPSTGFHRITVCLTQEDDDRTDDCMDGTLIVGSNPECMAINEIMPRPRTGEPEWIELWNAGSEEIDLEGWSIMDATATKPCVICESQVRIPANGFVVIASHSIPWTFFQSPEYLLIPKSFPILNDDGDWIKLFDAAGIEIDQIHYTGTQLGEAGQSLERISVDMESNDPSNWTPCPAWEGATPGKINSVYSNDGNDSVGLIASPNPFSPDGDGYEDLMGLAYNLPSGAYRLDLRIFDLQGRCIRSLRSGVLSSSKETQQWDGKDDEGRLAPIGMYIGHLEAFNLNTQRIYHVVAVLALAGRL
jgi:hypothetical protein